MSAFTAMAEIESFTGKGSKKLKADRMKKLSEHERRVFCLAYDPWKVYYLIVDPPAKQERRTGRVRAD
jgi:hypothetical protein